MESTIDNRMTAAKKVSQQTKPQKREEEMAAGVSDNAQQPITLSALAGTSSMAPYFKIRFSFKTSVGMPFIG